MAAIVQSSTLDSRLARARRLGAVVRRRWPSYFASLLIALWAVLAMAPVASILLGSLKSSSQFTSDPLGLPNPLRFDNYVRGWEGVAVGQPMWVYLLNTVPFTVVAVVVSTLGGTLAAYTISRKDTRWARSLSRYFMVLNAVPFIAAIIPLYSLTGILGLRSNPAGIGLVFAAGWLPLTVLLMLGYFSSFPFEVLEAAKMDGSSEFRLFFSVVLPMSKGAVLSNVLLCFINAWTNLSYTLPLLVDPSSTTVSPGLLLFSSQQYSVDQGAQLAGTVITIVPLVVAYLVLHRHIMESFRVGAFR